MNNKQRRIILILSVVAAPFAWVICRATIDFTLELPATEAALGALVAPILSVGIGMIVWAGRDEETLPPLGDLVQFLLIFGGLAVLLALQAFGVFS